MKLQLLSTKRGMKSQSLKRLADELTKRVHYKVFRTTLARPDRLQLRYGNQVNKLSQYKWFKKNEISTFEFTTDPGVAQTWVNQGETVFGRETLIGSNGKGIVIFGSGPDDKKNITPCEVYTKYKKKKREFRVHIFKDKVVSVVEKRKKHNHEGHSDPRIRNLANGYVFCQEVELTEALRKKIEETALKASKVCAKSHFRGVDLGYNQAKDDVFVIEVNSAPGIEGTNVTKYCDAILA